MISEIADPREAVATIFNAAVAASAIGSAWELGLLDEVQSKKEVDLEEFCLRNDLDLPSMQMLVTALEITDILVRESGERSAVIPGRLLEETIITKSLFHWLMIGSAGLFSRIPHVIRNANRAGTFFTRDPIAISEACKDINEQHFEKFFWQAMSGLDQQVSCVVDLGSGSGERLVQILEKHPAATGIGIDISLEAVQQAEFDTSNRGFGERLSFVEGDARDMHYQDEFASVSLITSFMFGHDLWRRDSSDPRKNCIASLRKIREAFPNAQRFLLGDTTRVLNCPESEFGVTGKSVPAFPLAFELGHDLMGECRIPTMEEWIDVFPDAGWRLRKRHLVQSSYLSVIFELE
ncbi:S-adenosyl-L-methionine-dependent methyltransferase [Ophiobolus disseminans]|uniref:S-adenosyl-L-methionine-dependent methyltransferase n=1 Tax=Ophiobolus disseminans TaxID=1469910 RepID=A0A6A7ADS4_9PLEO|nr:S-adenosyl-L-methionine-dependent methyltransferase [Ophiobolus disseminans]